MIGTFTLVFWSSISPYFSVPFDLVVCYLTLLVMKIKLYNWYGIAFRFVMWLITLFILFQFQFV